MSLSNKATSKPVTGRVIIGLNMQGSGETTVRELENRAGKRPAWDEKAEEEYLSRVRQKATEMAKGILEKGMAEAEELRQQAVAEGFEQGMAQAQEQITAMLDEQANTLGAMLQSLQDQGPEHWKRYREDITTLVRLATEKCLRVEMDCQRQDILASLLDQALEAVDAHTGLTIRVHPEDAEGMDMLLENAKARHPGLDRWRVRGDEAVASGGLILESGHGMVDNSIDGRWKNIDSVFEQLVINGDDE